MSRFIFILVLLTSCTTQRKVEAWMSRNPVKGAVICNDRYPVQESHDTTYITDTLKERIYQYEIRYEHDTILQKLQAGCDTITVTKVMQRIKTLPAPPPQTKVVTRTVESTAKLTIAEGNLKAMRGERNFFMWAFLIALLYILYRLAKDRYNAKY